jgi:aminopeptidase YwaD
MRRAAVGSVTAVLLLTAGCSDQPVSGSRQPVETTSTPTATMPTMPTQDASTVVPKTFEVDRAMATVRLLARSPRLATAPAYAAAADLLQPRLESAGYAVRRQRFPVPVGDSWGVPAEAGTSFNVIAEPPAFDPDEPHRVIGAHLDTVAVSPGAEDNASGVSVVMELARVLAGEPQVVLVLFGGEEPRGPGDLHHFGSKRYVEDAGSVTAMVSLDRVGVGTRVPIGFFPGTDVGPADALAAAAKRAKVPVVVVANTTSDHESFAVEGLPAARLGSTDYDEYHSEDDLPRVVDPAQLERVGRVVMAWLRAS